jgi:flagellar hook-length control protein FliK
MSDSLFQLISSSFFCGQSQSESNETMFQGAAELQNMDFALLMTLLTGENRELLAENVSLVDITGTDEIKEEENKDEKEDEKEIKGDVMPDLSLSLLGCAPLRTSSAMISSSSKAESEQDGVLELKSELRSGWKSEEKVDSLRLDKETEGTEDAPSLLVPEEKGNDDTEENILNSPFPSKKKEFEKLLGLSPRKVSLIKNGMDSATAVVERVAITSDKPVVNGQNISKEEALYLSDKKIKQAGDSSLLEKSSGQAQGESAFRIQMPVYEGSASSTLFSRKEAMMPFEILEKEPSVSRHKVQEEGVLLAGTVSTKQPEFSAAQVALQRGVYLGGDPSECFQTGLSHVLRFLHTRGETRATVVIDPPALGRVDVELVSTQRGLEALFRVGNEQLRQTVQEQLPILKSSFQQQGLILADCSVDVRDERGSQHHPQESKGRKFSFGTQEDDVDAVLAFRIDLEQGLLFWMA